MVSVGVYSISARKSVSELRCRVFLRVSEKGWVLGRVGISRDARIGHREVIARSSRGHREVTAWGLLYKPLVASGEAWAGNPLWRFSTVGLESRRRDADEPSNVNGYEGAWRAGGVATAPIATVEWPVALSLSKNEGLAALLPLVPVVVVAAAAGFATAPPPLTRVIGVGRSSSDVGVSTVVEATPPKNEFGRVSENWFKLFSCGLV